MLASAFGTPIFLQANYSGEASDDKPPPAAGGSSAPGE